MSLGEYEQKLLIFCLYFLFKKMQHFSLYFEFKIIFNIILFLFRILIMTNNILCTKDINLGQSKVKTSGCLFLARVNGRAKKTTGVL